MTQILLIVAAALLSLGQTVHAQEHQHYAGLQDRAVKALSDQQLADLRAGRGMGLALAAELNGYPGPVHVLELQGALDLTAEQSAKVRQLYEAMRAETIPLGERLIGQEAELERLFASRTVTPDSLASTTSDIGTTQAALRAAHLRYHMSTAAILQPGQMSRYAELRGYAAGRRGTGGHHGAH